MFIAGCDYSIATPSICIYDTSKEFNSKNCFFFYLYNKKKWNQDFDNVYGCLIPEYKCPEERYFNNAKWAMSIFNRFQVNIVSLEAFSYGSTGSSIFQTAENAGVLKNQLWLNNIEIFYSSPSNNKKIWTGKGNAGKELMVQTFLDREGTYLYDLMGIKKIDEKPFQDMVDSYALVNTYIESQKNIQFS